MRARVSLAIREDSEESPACSVGRAPVLFDPPRDPVLTAAYHFNMRKSVAALLVAAFLSGCAWLAEVDPGELPVYLQPLPGATEVRAAQADEEDAAIEYKLRACYPAQEQLARISERLPAGWKPRKEDFLNPGVTTSHVRGWMQYPDMTRTPETQVYHWAGEWENAKGSILSYDLMYRTPLNARTPACEMQVYAHLRSAERVREDIALVRKH